MIRYACQNDLTQIRSLWDLSFHGEELFTEWYFKTCYKPENTLIFEQGGKIIGELQRLPYQLCGVGEVTYIFGACTHPDFRGKGIMSELLEFSHEQDIKLDKSASILIPASESLFDYYAKFGYESKFTILKKECVKQNGLTHNMTFKECTINNIIAMNSLYEKILGESFYIKRTVEQWETQIKMFNDLEGKVFGLFDSERLVGYAFVWNEEKTSVAELVGDNDEVKKILCSEMLKYFKTDRLEALCLDNATGGERFGCIKTHKPIDISSPLKMNLMFN